MNISTEKLRYGKVNCFGIKNTGDYETTLVPALSRYHGSSSYTHASEVVTVSKGLKEDKNIPGRRAAGMGTSMRAGQLLDIENELKNKLNLGLGTAAEIFLMANTAFADAVFHAGD